MNFQDFPITYVTCSENGFYGLRYLRKQGWKISQVITISQQAALRYQVSGYVDIRQWCSSEKINCTSLDDYTVSKKDVNINGSKLMIVNGWNRLIKKDVIQMFELGGLAVHAGHPPIGLGRAPLPWNIIKGNKDLEVYVFKMTERADDGAIMSLRPVEITDQDNIASLYQKVMFQSALLFEKALHLLVIGEKGTAQQTEYQVHYPKRAAEDGAIDFRAPMHNIYNFIRAQSKPYPGAFASLDGVRWTIWDAQPFDSYAFRDQVRTPGKILAALPKGLVVQTGTSALWITAASNSSGIVIPDKLENLELYVDKIFIGAKNFFPTEI